MKIYAYKQGSASAKALSEALNAKRIRHEGGVLNIVKQTVINWGASHIKRNIICRAWLNAPSAVRRASNKLETFKSLDGKVCIPEWTEDPQVAFKWLQEGCAVVGRFKLNGHSGEGIEIYENLNNWNYEEENAPLYTKYIKKDQEYRIHVFQGEAFFIQRKARKREVPDDQVNWQIRNYANGFIFANQDVDVCDEAKMQAVNAVAALDLDFGAVDIIVDRLGNWYVLEVNTACGLEGKTLQAYVEKFKQLGY